MIEIGDERDVPDFAPAPHKKKVETASEADNKESQVNDKSTLPRDPWKYGVALQRAVAAMGAEDRRRFNCSVAPRGTGKRSRCGLFIAKCTGARSNPTEHAKTDVTEKNAGR